MDYTQLVVFKFLLEEVLSSMQELQRISGP